MRKIYKVIDLSIDIMKSTKDSIPSLETGRLAPLIEQLEDKPNKNSCSPARLWNICGQL